MRRLGPLSWMVLAALPTTAAAQRWEAPGRLVGISVSVDGVETPLYAAPDGSGRHYLEARRGAAYEVQLANRTGRRLGVVLVVDGLNVISGQREAEAAGSGPGRMYILEPWDTTTVRGWRSSLQEVRRFTFVDEAASYASRSGKANGKMGWIEARVYREDAPEPRIGWRQPRILDGGAPAARSQAEGEPGAEEAARPAAPAPPAGEPHAGPDALGPSADAERGATMSRRPARESYPGTGWGPRADDPAVIVSFTPERHAAERISLRYEYARALRALGILPSPRPRDRLQEREQGIHGFAAPPVW